MTQAIALQIAPAVKAALRYGLDDTSHFYASYHGIYGADKRTIVSSARLRRIVPYPVNLTVNGRSITVYPYD